MYVMATTASKAIMGVLAEKLKALLGREYDLQVGVHDDVKSLQSELEFMHAFLQDYDYASYRHYLQQTTTSAQDKVWVRKVRELAYHVEDAIDDFTCRVGPAPKEIPDMVKHFVYTLMARHQIAKQLRRLRLEAQELSEQRARYPPLGTPPSSTTTVQLQWQLPPPPDETTSTNLLVGIDGPRDEFIANLTSAARKHGSGRRRVASMVGIAGVGKTTLAKAVYHSLEDSFQCRAFVTVSRKPDPRRVLKDILQQVMITTGSGSSPAIASMETWEDSQFVDRLRDNLKDKRYLIIVDDLWEIPAWDRISRALPDNSLDSMIITTTRNESVAKACCPRHHPGHFVYKVASLKHLDSRTLFLRRTFGSEDNFPHDLEELSTKILKKCAGLPLVIVCISSILATKGKEATEWEKVYDSLGSGSNDGLSWLWQAFEVSYDDLPQHLKVCLLYLSAFREDYAIRRDRLTRRWITEGFVDEKPGMSMQEVADNNFTELIDRNMIQAVDVDCFGEIHACKIHDVMFDLITKKSSEENFVTFIHGKSTSTQRQFVRRLSLDYGTTTDDLDLTNFNVTHVRSLTIYGNINKLDSVPLGRYLRMLDFECCEGVNSRHLKDIGELILLKYLSLKSTWISELPRQIGDLKCLETLDLTQTNIRELPVEVTRLQRLVHLLAGGAELPQGIGNMRPLQILCIRVACKRSKEAVKELLRLTNLRKLDMTYVHLKGKEGRKYEDECVNTLSLIMSELSKCKLQSLHLNLLGNYSISSFLRIYLTPSLITSPPDHLQNLRIIGDYGFPYVPRWIGLLSQLTDLELTVRTMLEKDVEIVAKLDRLVRFRLTVKEPSTTTKGIIVLESGFPCLKELFISCRIMPVSFNQGAMPKLEKFVLQFHAYQGDSKRTCPSIEHLKSLIKGFQFRIVVGKGLSHREVKDLKNTFKSAIFI